MPFFLNKKNMENADFTYLNNEILENLSREDTNYVDISKKIALDVKAGKLSVLEIIQKLGCLLTSQSFSKREIGVLILSETLDNINLGSTSNNFNPEQLSVLSSYFSEKLKDHHQVATSAFKGVLALVASHGIPSESIIQLVTSIYNHITCQQQQQQDRYLIFQIFETVLNKHTKEVGSMGIDFVYGVISSIDGERDPKNLLYLFDWLQSFLKTVKLGHLTEEMFEVLACYFPVDFKAPPSDKNKITREDLASRLCQCLTCIPDFGPHGIPLALEKLDSALKIAKEDSLDILKNGCKNYETSIYYQHSVEVLSQIQKEIFITTDTSLQQKCLETLREIIKKLSQGDPKKFEAIIIDITDTLKRNLMPESKLFSQSSQILIFVSHASETSSITVTKKVAPFLENTFKITKNPEQKCVILNIFIAFVKTVIDNNNNIDLSNFEELASVPMLCLQATLDPSESLRIQGFKGFTEIARFIPESVRQPLFTNLHELIMVPQKDEVKNQFFRCLTKMAEIFSQQFDEKVLHKEKIYELNALDMYLESLSNILKVSYFEDYVIDTLQSYSLDNVGVSEVALKHLYNILSGGMGVDSILEKKNFIVKFIDFLVNLENVPGTFLCNVNLILQSIVRNREVILQQEVYFSQSTKNFRNQAVYVSVLSGLIVPMRKGVFKDYEKIEFLLDCSLNGSDEFVRNISLEILANVLNKIDNEQILTGKISKIGILCDNCSNTETKIRVITWVVKSLVSRNHSSAWSWVDKLINCLNESTNAAKRFRDIMDETSTALSKQNDCQIMPLYKQKFFTYVTNKINELSQTDKPEYFTVVGYLLENTPRQAVIGQFKKIIRLILLCLETCTEAEVLYLIIQRIMDFVASGEAVVENSFEDIFLRVLNLTSFDASMVVRMAAIQCVQQFTTSYPIYKLLPYKQKVIHQLGICVDDKKRLVRRQAMACRALWYLLDAPE